MQNYSSPDTGRPLRKDAARNRVLLIDAAREVFATRGFEASMDEIAHRAGLGVGTAYRHFANKYELANAIFDTAVEAFVDSASADSEAVDAWENLLGLMEQTMIAQTGNRGIREILLLEHQDDWEHHDQMVRPFFAAFERAQRDGAVRADAQVTDLALIVEMLCAICERTEELSPEIWRRYLPTLMAGLRPGGPPLPEPPLSSDQLRTALARSLPRTAVAAATTTTTTTA